MTKQGAKSFGDLVFLDQSLFLGRPAGKGDIVDAEYGMPPSKSKGGKDAVKYGAETFSTEIKASRKQQSVQPIKTFVLHGLAFECSPGTRLSPSAAQARGAALL